MIETGKLQEGIFCLLLEASWRPSRLPLLLLLLLVDFSFAFQKRQINENSYISNAANVLFQIETLVEIFLEIWTRVTTLMQVDITGKPLICSI